MLGNVKIVYQQWSAMISNDFDLFYNRWRDYKPCGVPIPGERIIAFKTPLSHVRWNNNMLVISEMKYRSCCQDISTENNHQLLSFLALPYILELTGLWIYLEILSCCSDTTMKVIKTMESNHMKGRYSVIY